MKKSLTEKLGNVVDRETYLEFVRALIDDWEKDVARINDLRDKNAYNPGWDNSEWQNSSISQYLEAASAWVDTGKLPDQPTWRAFAEFLYAGKIYE